MPESVGSKVQPWVERGVFRGARERPWTLSLDQDMWEGPCWGTGFSSEEAAHAAVTWAELPPL